MSEEPTKLRMLQVLDIPMLPNFLRFKGNPNQAFAVSRLTDEEIKELGKLWTNALLEKAKKDRVNF